MEGIECANCGKIGEDVYFCGKHNDAAYCSIECRCLHSSHQHVCSSQPQFCHYCAARVKTECDACGLIGVCHQCESTHKAECGTIGLPTNDVSTLVEYIADNSSMLLEEVRREDEVPSLHRILRFDITETNILFRDCINSSKELSPYHNHLTMLLMKSSELAVNLIAISPVILQAIDGEGHIIFETVISLSP